MQFPTPQGTTSPTFHAPPLDGSLTLVDIFDFHAKHSPDHPLFRYDDGGVHTVHWREAVRAFHIAARKVQEHVKGADATAGMPVVAILAVADSITYFSLVVGIMRAGYLPFPISTRNSDVAVAHLLKTTHAKHLFVSHDPVMQKLAHSACARLESDDADASRISLLPMPSFNSLYGPTVEDVEFLPPLENTSQDSPCVIMHSSGSTAFPKAVTLSYRMMFEHGLQPYYGEIDLCGQVLSAHAVAMFHLMGVILIPWTSVTGLTLSVFPPSETPMIPTSERVLSGAVATDSTLIFCVPAFLENWSRDPSRLPALRKFKTIIFGGGPLQHSVGDMLTENGVIIAPLYGLTETGTLTLFLPKQPPKEGWDYFRVSPHVDAAFTPIEGEEHIFRLIVKKCLTHTPAVINTIMDGKQALDTNDLVVRHPTNHQLYKIYGRYDDQIMHSTGEKTNPTPIEAMLLKDTRITSAIMFGRSKFHAGVLVTPSAEHVFDPSDLVRLAAYRNLIWDTVEQANRFAPQHSRIFKEMIVVAHPNKPFEYTAKGTPRRHVVLKSYEAEIEAAYKAVEDSAQPGSAPPKLWELNDVTEFVQAAVRKALDIELSDSDDIFHLGGDSLSATSIRNSILLALRQSGAVSTASVRALPTDFVFSFPTIATLSAFVYGVALSSQTYKADKSKEVRSKIEDPEGQFKWPELGQVGQTIIKLRKGKGEPPLILLPGGGGTIHGLGPLQERFRSAVWAIQVTPDTPVGSLDEMAAFYLRKIKEELPQGPYRLSSYSGSSIVMIALAKLLESNGDHIIQFAFLDHFPTMFLAPLIGFDIETLDLDNPDSKKEFNRVNIQNLCDMLRRDGDGTNARLHQLARELWDEYSGVTTSTWSHTNWINLNAFLELVFGFIGKLPAEAGADVDKPGKRALAALIQWIKGIKTVPTVYIASKGVLGMLPPADREEWADLGVRWCSPDAKMIYLDAGHYDILTNDTVFNSLQEGYL